jgi:hypothetical protein
MCVAADEAVLGELRLEINGGRGGVPFWELAGVRHGLGARARVEYVSVADVASGALVGVTINPRNL